MDPHVSATSAVRPAWANIYDLCQHFGISRNTALRWISRGAPVVRLRRKLLFRIEAVEVWVRKEFGAGDWGDESPAQPRTRRSRKVR